MDQDNGPKEPTNGQSIGAKWGDKALQAKGTFGLSVFVVLLLAALVVFTIWRTGTTIRDAAVQTRAAGHEISASFKTGSDAIIAVLKEAEQQAAAQHDMLAAAQRLTTCLNSYDAAARQVLRARAEKGEVNLDTLCRWLRADEAQTGRRPRETP